MFRRQYWNWLEPFLDVRRLSVRIFEEINKHGNTYNEGYINKDLMNY